MIDLHPTFPALTTHPVLSQVCTAIVRFLDYNLLLAATTLPEQLVRHWATLEMSQEETAKRLGVAPRHVGAMGAGRGRGRAYRHVPEARGALPQR